MRFRLVGALALVAGLILAVACGGGQKKKEKKQTQSEDTEAIRKAKNEKAARDADCAIAIMKNAQELGGQVEFETAVPGVGRFAVIRDPTGAHLSAIQYESKASASAS